MAVTCSDYVVSLSCSMLGSETYLPRPQRGSYAGAVGLSGSVGDLGTTLAFLVFMADYS